MKEYLVNYVMNRMDGLLLELLREHSMETIRQAIVRRGIFGILLTDLNLISGRTITMKISDGILKVISENEYLLEVPENIRRNCNINSVDLLQYDFDALSGNYHPQSIRPSLYKELDRVTGISNVSQLTKLEVVGNKHILIHADTSMSESMLSNSTLTFNIGYTEAFETIEQAYYPEFGPILIKAIEMILYTKRLSLRRSKLHQPIMDDSIESELSNFSDAADQYQEMLDKMAKIGFMTQVEKMEKFNAWRVGKL